MRGIVDSDKLLVRKVRIHSVPTEFILLKVHYRLALCLGKIRETYSAAYGRTSLSTSHTLAVTSKPRLSQVGKI